jgi:hypothetical protein
MNAFYSFPKPLQWTVALLLVVIGFGPAIAIIELGYTQSLFYLLFLFYVPIGQFAFTPLLKLVGAYRYYSPMLLGYMPNDKQIDLHSGGSFDYLWVMCSYRRGAELRHRLMRYHLEGLLHIATLIEQGSIPATVEIIGTSYFFNERTLQKMGFVMTTPTWFYRLNLLVNCIDLTWMYSLAQGRLAIPKVWDAKKAAISGQRLLENKGHIEALLARMQARAANT